MQRHLTLSLGALSLLASSTFGCNSVLGIEEKQRGDAQVDAGRSDIGSFALSIVNPAAGGDGGTRPPSRLVRGASISLGLTVTRSGGFEGTVTVLVSGLARGVTAAPVVVPGSQTTGTLTIQADASAELGPMSLAILAAHESVVLDPLALPVTVQDAPGTPDTTFGSGGKVVIPVGSGVVGPGGIQLLPNGSIVLCGRAKRDGFDSSIAISRVTASGALDPTFALGAGAALGNSPGSKADSCAAVFLRPNGGIVYTGFATPTADQPHAMLTGRYRPDGFPDQNFGNPPSGFGTTPLDGTGSEGYFVLGPTPNDTFVVGGIGRGHPALLRFNKNGLLDQTFGTESAQGLTVAGGIRWLTQQTTGNFVGVLDASTFLAARFLSDGSLDKSFGDDGTKSVAVGGEKSSAAVVVAQPDDTIVLAGTETIATDTTDIALVRLTKSGQLDPTFGNAGIGTLHFAGPSIVSSAAENEGAIFMAGQTPTDAGPAFTVLRITGDGSLDATFGTGGREALGVGMAQAMTVDDFGRILVAGFVGGATEGTIVVYRLWP